MSLLAQRREKGAFDFNQNENILAVFRFSSAQRTPVNVEPSEASLKGVNKKKKKTDLISAAGEKNKVRLHITWVETFGLGMEESAWGDRMSTSARKSRWGQRKWLGHCRVTRGIVFWWPFESEHQSRHNYSLPTWYEAGDIWSFYLCSLQLLGSSEL